MLIVMKDADKWISRMHPLTEYAEHLLIRIISIKYLSKDGKSEKKSMILII